MRCLATLTLYKSCRLSCAFMLEGLKRGPSFLLLAEDFKVTLPSVSSAIAIRVLMSTCLIYTGTSKRVPGAWHIVRRRHGCALERTMCQVPVKGSAYPLFGSGITAVVSVVRESMGLGFRVGVSLQDPGKAYHNATDVYLSLTSECAPIFANCVAVNIRLFAEGQA